MEEKKTSRWAYLIVVPILVIIIGFIVNNSNQYYDLSHIANKDLDNLYIKGRNSRYNKALNYLYGDRIKAAKLPDGFSDDVPLIFYDENGKEKLKILFYSNQKLVRINNKKYLYMENNIAIHRAKELYPDKNKSDCEKMMFNIMIVMIFITSFSMSTAIIIYWVTNSILAILQNLLVKRSK